MSIERHAVRSKSCSADHPPKLGQVVCVNGPEKLNVASLLAEAEPIAGNHAFRSPLMSIPPVPASGSPASGVPFKANQIKSASASTRKSTMSPLLGVAPVNTVEPPLLS